MDDRELERLNEEALRSIPVDPPDPPRGPTWAEYCPACKGYPGQAHTLDWRCAETWTRYEGGRVDSENSPPLVDNPGDKDG